MFRYVSLSNGLPMRMPHNCLLLLLLLLLVVVVVVVVVQQISSTSVS